MGIPDTVMQCYLSGKGRFADLFNGVFFQGEQFIRSCDLQDSSERYSVEALSVFLNIPDLWDKRERYRNKTCEREEYDMCQAWGGVAQEFYAEGMAEGIAQGMAKGSFEKTRMIVQNMLKRGFSDKDICELTGCTAEFINELQ